MFDHKPLMLPQYTTFPAWPALDHAQPDLDLDQVPGPGPDQGPAPGPPAGAAPLGPAGGQPPPGGGAGPVPLEHLEAQLCELAGHLAAATARFLALLADFDARRGWAAWDMPSCAAWLSWKCQLSSGTAREHVRVARALPALPVISQEFAAGRLSFSKVRALTRIATPATDAGLAQMATPMTANQLERFARAHRTVTAVDDQTARVRRRLTYRQDDDGSLALTVHLPPLQGAVLLQALRAASNDLDHPHDEQPQPEPAAGTAGAEHTQDPEQDREPAGSVSAETPGSAPAGSRRARPTSTSLADALMVIAEAFLAGKVATAANPDLYQVIIHLGTGTGPAPGGVSAETLPSPVAGPAAASRCHVEDGPAISVTTAQMIACETTLSWMRHAADGTVLDVGRRRRRPTAAIRRAVRERDRSRCRFPGCTSRRIDLHHIQFWRNGGKTSAKNLISLCKHHHWLVHEHGYTIATGPGAAFLFFRPDGQPIPASPALPEPDGDITTCHDAAITPETIIPPWYGEHLDLDYAIATCFAGTPVPSTPGFDQQDAATDPQPAPTADQARNSTSC